MKRTNLKSQIAAMKYLAKMKPRKYTIKNYVGKVVLMENIKGWLSRRLHTIELF